MRVLHALKTILAFFEMSTERAEHAARALATCAVQLAVDQRFRIVVVTVAGYNGAGKPVKNEGVVKNWVQCV